MTSIPSALSAAVDFSELDTAALIRSRILPSSSMKCITVEPVPTPTTLPSSTNLIAACADLRFCSSWFMRNTQTVPMRIHADAGSSIVGARFIEPGSCFIFRGKAGAMNRAPTQSFICMDPSPNPSFQRENEIPLRLRHRQHGQTIATLDQGEVLQF